MIRLLGLALAVLLGAGFWCWVGVATLLGLLRRKPAI